MNSIYDKIKQFRKSESARRLIEIEKDFERWIKEAAFMNMHG